MYKVYLYLKASMTNRKLKINTSQINFEIGWNYMHNEHRKDTVNLDENLHGGICTVYPCPRYTSTGFPTDRNNTELSLPYLPYVPIDGLLTGGGRPTARFDRVPTGLRVLTDFLREIHRHGVTPDEFRVRSTVMQCLTCLRLGSITNAWPMFLSEIKMKVKVKWLMGWKWLLQSP